MPLVDGRCGACGGSSGEGWGAGSIVVLAALAVGGGYGGVGVGAFAIFSAAVREATSCWSLVMRSANVSFARSIFVEREEIRF